MSTSSTIAASCAALGNAINQIVLDSRCVARKVRESRHAMNGINGELLAIKTTLEILHDDCTKSPSQAPSPLLVPIASIVALCGDTINDVHKLTIILSTSADTLWTEAEQEGTRLARHRLELLRLALDLALDHCSIFLVANLSADVPRTASQSKPGLGDISQLLARIDTEYDSIKQRKEDNTGLLLRWLEDLRQCIEAIHEAVSKDEEPKRSDSAEPEAGYLSRNISHLSSKTSSTESNGASVGAWLESVSAHTVQRPSQRPAMITISGAPKPTNVEPRTFYAESSSSGSYSTAKSWYSRTKSRTGGPLPILRSKKKKKQSSSPPSTTAESEPSMPRLPIRSLDPDKMPIAKSRRLALSEDQRVALDWDLRHISSIASATSVERVLREGADPNVEDAHFGRLYVRAAYHLPLEIVRLLVDYGADITQTGVGPYHSALHAAVLGQRLEIVKYLVELSADMESMNTAGETPLHLALQTAGAYPIAKYLLEAGADVDVSSDVGLPLHVALSTSKLDSRERSMMVELLLAHGAEGEVTAESCVRRGKGLSILGLI